MKTKFNFQPVKAGLSMAGILYMSLVQTVNAQSLVVPSTADIQQYTTGSTNFLTGLNAAAIAYNSGSPSYFFATVTYDYSNSYIYVTDPSLGQTITITSVGTMAGTPDVIIGDNNMGGSYTVGQDFIMAVCFLNNSGDIEVDYYDVIDDGVTLSSGGYLGNNTLTGYLPLTCNVHMDVVAEYNNVGITGFPFCDNFVLTWDDYNGGNPQVWGVLGNLNSQSLGSVQAISPGGSSIYGIQADVAAIQQHISGPAANMNVTAWITYLDAGGANKLYLTEYDFTASSAISTITLDNGTYNSTNMFLPRIDAYDFYNTQNNPAHYKVVQQVLNSRSSFCEIRTYDNNLVGSTPPFYVSSQFCNVSGLGAPYTLLTPPYHHFNPTVAGGVDYMVQHPTNISSNNYALFMEPIDIFSSQIKNPPNNYYWVNSNTTPPSLTPIIGGANAVCTPPNFYSLVGVYAWGFDNTIDMEVDYKVTSSYGFKNGNNAASENHHSLHVYPNPAKNEITVTNTLAPVYATQYEILDITGKTVQKGNMQPGDVKVDISSLVTGTYVIKTYCNGAYNGHELFFKN